MSLNHNIVSRFIVSAKQFPDKIAIVHKDKKISYGAMLKTVKHKAAYFKQKGIKPGDRVLVFVPMSIDLYTTVLALFYCGAVAVFLDEWVNKKRMELCCKIAACRGFVANGKIRMLALLSKEIRSIPIWLKSNQIDKNEDANAYNTLPDNTALITFTTGSTGTPKAANRTHAFLDAQFTALNHEIKPNVNDVDLPVLPIVLLMNLGAGCTSVISSFKSAKPWKTNFNQIAQLIQREKINRLESSPDFVLKLAQHCIDNAIKLPSLKKIFTGGAPVFPVQAQVLCKAFPECESFIVYGSTEAEPISLLRAQDMPPANTYNTGIPVGTIYDGARVAILPIQPDPYTFATEKDFVAMQLPKNKVGEIVVSGKHVLRSYINNDDALRHAKIFINDVCWHRTGDSGFIDEHGKLFLCGRASMIIEHKGSIVYPFLYENAVLESGLSTMGTVMHVNNALVLVIEGEENQIEAFKNYFNARHLGFEKLMFIKKIPRDARHHSKIDYAKLTLLLKKQA